jgi:hypothetical protein
MKSWKSIILIAGVAALAAGCTAKLDPAQMARIEAASNSAEAAANKCQAAADEATGAAARAADSAEAAERASRKAEAIFGSSLRK